MNMPPVPSPRQVAVLQGSLRGGSFARMLAQTLPGLAPKGCSVGLMPLPHEVPP